MYEDHKINDVDMMWAKVENSLSFDRPSSYFVILKKYNCLDKWFPELKALIGVPAGPKEWHPEEDAFDHAMNALDYASQLTGDIGVRWAALCHDLGKGKTDPSLWPYHQNHDKLGVIEINRLCERFKLSDRLTKSAVMACEEHMRSHRLEEMNAGKAVRFLQRIGNFPSGIEGFCFVITADSKHLLADSHEINGKNRIVELIKFAYPRIMKISLPDHQCGRGEISSNILLNMRCHEWKRLKVEFYKSL